MKGNKIGCKYYTSPDFSEYRLFKMGEQPSDWIPGIKITSRNEKISKNSRWRT